MVKTTEKKYKNKINKLENENKDLMKKIEFLKSFISMLCVAAEVDSANINIDFDFDF